MDEERRDASFARLLALQQQQRELEAARARHEARSVCALHDVRSMAKACFILMPAILRCSGNMAAGLSHPSAAYRP